MSPGALEPHIATRAGPVRLITRHSTARGRVSAARHTAGEGPAHPLCSGCCRQDKVPTSYHHLFQTGPPGAGKVTPMRRVDEALAVRRGREAGLWGRVQPRQPVCRPPPPGAGTPLARATQVAVFLAPRRAQRARHERSVQPATRGGIVALADPIGGHQPSVVHHDSPAIHAHQRSGRKQQASPPAKLSTRKCRDWPDVAGSDPPQAR